MALVIEFPKPIEPPIVRPTLPRPGSPTPDISWVLLYLLEVLAENVSIGDDDAWWKPWTDTKAQGVRKKTGRACSECCGIVTRHAQKAVRRMGPALDEVSPETKDSVKRFRRAKVTRAPAW